MRPLLMVHGLGGSAHDTFGAPGRFSKKTAAGGMCLFLQQQGYQPGRDLFWYTYNSFQPVPASARRLKKELATILTDSGKPGADLLTFSLGGIVSKYFAVSPLYEGEIRRLIMVAPPFYGSPWANWLRTRFVPGESDYIFPGDGRSLSPQILSFKSPFLMKLAQTPFPSGIETTIIAARATAGAARDPLSSYARWLTTWLGEGDSVVPLKSTKIPVDHYYELAEEFSIRIMHRFLPFHPQIQQLVAQQLRSGKAGSSSCRS